MKLPQVGKRLRDRLTSRKGQNTVEYLMMLTVIVAVVVIAGAGLKKFMPQLFEKVSNMITGAADNMGNTQ